MVNQTLIKGCEECITPVKCRICGVLFDISIDVKESKKKSAEQVIEEDCGTSEHLCWECRNC